MQNLNIKIYGDYWESFVYMEKLYLLTSSNKLIVYDWKQIIRDCKASNNKEIVISEHNVNRHYLLQETDSPFKELAIDIQIVNKKLYAITDNGFYSSNLNAHIDSTNKLWDNKSFSINSNGRGQISLSSGSDGLFEYSKDINIFGLKSFERNIFQISENHSTSSTYSNYNIYNNSEINNSELDLFEINQDYSKSFFKRFSEKEIFGYLNQKPSWIHKDKIYRIKNHNEIEVRSIKNYKQNLFSNSEIMRFQGWKGEILSGLSTQFGIVVECEHALVVSFSSSSFINIPGDVIKWRVFPNSKQYLNDLHVIFDDYIEIYCFY